VNDRRDVYPMGKLRWLGSAIQGAVVAVAFFAAVVVFRLGWFFPIVAVVGAAVAAMVAARWGESQGCRIGRIALALGSYALVFAILVWALVGHQSVRTFQATWQDHGVGNFRQDAEVFFEFVDYPQPRYWGVLDSPSRPLAADGTASVQIDFLVTSDLGCVRGFRHVRIGDIVDPAVINGNGGYSRGGQSVRSPWASDFWWCQ